MPFGKNFLNDLDLGSRNFLKGSSPPMVVNYITYIEKVEQMAQGGECVSMSQRKVEGSFNNSSFNGNTNIQGDHLEQNQLINEQRFEEAFQRLFEEIEAIKDSSQREQANYFAQELKSALEKQDKDKGKKLIGFLKGTLGNVSSLMTIASFFGFSL